ncbi:type II toxin-antitoxin system RelE/ParE family toxin [Desulfosarcina sp. OttesenSCG-928-A07]|nr:type II toxin-antitoxin system RelE/ParE family toxin [Desulfosarcina sp. OttesenSCG-928-G17]MDL2328931.1 type II toxin-antitoxin system RelE/ParE family toxin [Desulfosarcina sp. OttesenSCG-928-A07]
MPDKALPPHQVAPDGRRSPQYRKILKGSRFSGLWRYRSGDYRILCEIQNEKITVLVVLVGHRREVCI